MTAETETCALCGIRPATTREHIPAKTLFPSPRPDNLLTVPACGPCNTGTARDDEYLRTYFALRVEHTPTKSLDVVRAKASRALVRREFGGLQETFARSIHFDWLVGPDARVLTLQSRMVPDLRRVLKVVRKHTRGLFYHVSGRVLQPDAKLIVAPDYQVETFPISQQRALDKLSKMSLTGTRENFGEVFGYALRITDDNPNVFCASLLYYKSFFYLVATRPSHSPVVQLPEGVSRDHAIGRLPR